MNRNCQTPNLLAQTACMTNRPPLDYTPYLKHAREQLARRRADPRIAARRERAWAVAREIAAFLREAYHPTRIVLFGSLTHTDLFDLHSDIDIAVEGIPWPAYLHAWNDVEERWPEFKVDLIDVGIVSPEMREWIEEGQVL
ncbi:MAG: nucleotidyltransferase family protein [Gammaproteobacteria bacterium]